MSIKLILGIFVPLVVVISLIVVSSLNIGFSMEIKTAESISYNTLFLQQNHVKDSVALRDITITNDYFLAKRIKLPSLVVCLNDKEGIKPKENLQARYNEGISYPSSENRIFEASMMNSISSDYYGYYGMSVKTIEIPAHNKKQVKALVEPKILYDYNYNYQDLNSYREYDELLLIETKDSDYIYCENLESKELDSAVHIPITGAPPDSVRYTCTDSDGGKSYYVKGIVDGHQLGTSPPIICDKSYCGPRTDSLNYSTYYDYCIDNNVAEAFCNPDGSINVDSGYICPNGCIDGACVP